MGTFRVRTLQWVAIIAAVFGIGECLHCFQCTNVPENIDCKNVTQCLSNQKCYVERQGHGNTTRFTFGCIDNQHCPDRHDFTIVGRAVDDRCFQCCLGDGCNRELCEVQHLPGANVSSVCADDPATNCYQLSKLLSICSDIPHAKNVCRKYCGLCSLVDGSWSHWSDWSSCTTTCGVGAATRRRTCSNPAPKDGGDNCTGNDNQAHSCFSRDCPVHGDWSPWAHWESCSVSCDVGVSKRHRTCTNPAPSVFGHYCIGDAMDFNICHQVPCNNITTAVPVNPTQTSDCHDILTECDVANRTTGICSSQRYARQMCPEFCGLCSIVDGQWVSWSSWGVCSTTCDHGTWTRSRSCTNPPPAKGGKPCVGNTTDTGVCNLRACPVHGGWSEWAHWTKCSSSCGQGITRRLRSCTNPRPSLLGNNCFGDSSDFAICLIKPCPVDGGWGDWSLWTGCSSSCGAGQKTRQRSCTSPRPSNGGHSCSGTSLEHQTCQAGSCSGLKIGFTVRYPNYNTSNPLRFQAVVTNSLNGYNAATGKFTCQYPGLYLFTVTIVRNTGNAYDPYCYIYVNGVYSSIEAYAADADTRGYPSATNNLVKHLNKGETVYLNCGKVAHMSPYSSFSGVLIQPDTAP